MCKIFSVGPVINPTLAWDLIRAVQPVITERDSDGYGVSWISARGVIGRRRWARVSQAWKDTPPLPSGLAKLWGFSEQEQDMVEGAPESDALAIISHARMATTGGKVLKNTHPFMSKEGRFSLIHNGVVSTEGKDLLGSECDSAGILADYLASGVNTTPGEIAHMALQVSGWYVCCVLGSSGFGAPYMDVFRSGGELYVAYVPTIGVIWATTEGSIRDGLRKVGDLRAKPNVEMPYPMVKVPGDSLYRVRLSGVDPTDPRIDGPFPYTHMSHNPTHYYSGEDGAHWLRSPGRCGVVTYSPQKKVEVLDRVSAEVQAVLGSGDEDIDAAIRAGKRWVAENAPSPTPTHKKTRKRRRDFLATKGEE